MTSVLLSVCKSYSNQSKRAKVRRKPPQLRYAYFIDENSKFHKRKLSKFEYFIFKYFKAKYKKRTFFCEICLNSFKGFVKNNKQQIECPYCK